MTPKEFKLWFDGFWAAADGAGVSIDALHELKKKVDSIEETTGYRPMQQHPPGTVVWEPCKTVPLGQQFKAPDFRDAVYNNGAVPVGATGYGSTTRATDK